MIMLDINRRPGYSLILRANHIITVTGDVTVYQIDPGDEPRTLRTTPGNVGPFRTNVSLMITVNSGQATVTDPVLNLGNTGGGGPGGPVDWNDIENRPDTFAPTLGNTATTAVPGNAAVRLAGAQTVAGIKTFSDIPILPATEPADDNQAARKGYVDSTVAAALGGVGDDIAAAVLAARASIAARAVTAAATINAANHLGQVVVSNAATGVVITLATDLPVNASGVILANGAGAVTIAAQSGVLNVATGKQPVIADRYQAVQWIKTAAGQITLFGALADAA